MTVNILAHLQIINFRKFFYLILIDFMNKKSNV